MTDIGCRYVALKGVIPKLPGTKCLLRIADNGKGLPDGLKPETASTLGFQTIYTIIRDQLNGSIEVLSDKGTQWNIAVRRWIYSERL